MAENNGTSVYAEKATIKLVEDNHVQLLPCRIEQRGPANVSSYFNPYIRKSESSESKSTLKTETDEAGQAANEGLVCSFRGYPLEGQRLAMPDHYKGLVIEKTCGVDDSKDGTGSYDAFVSTSFSGITYWNWDSIPSKNDALQQALDWIPLAEALHAPSL
nr:EOG090X0IC1 [Lepidurus arcticus]